MPKRREAFAHEPSININMYKYTTTNINLWFCYKLPHKSYFYNYKSSYKPLEKPCFVLIITQILTNVMLKQE